VFSLTALILTALVCLVLGGLIGYAIVVNASPDGGSSRRTLENRLKSTEQQLQDYQAQVAQHFERTAELVNNLTESYRDVHEHLASGASRLADTHVSEQFLANANRVWLKNDQTKELLDENSQIEPPKDWAPEKGTLSETFGLDHKNDPVPPNAPPVR